MLIMALLCQGPFIWRFQSPHHRQAALFYYCNINCASSGCWVIIFLAIRPRELGRERVAGSLWSRKSGGHRDRELLALHPDQVSGAGHTGHRDGGLAGGTLHTFPSPQLPCAVSVGFLSAEHTQAPVRTSGESTLVEEQPVLNLQP